MKQKKILVFIFLLLLLSCNDKNSSKNYESISEPEKKCQSIDNYTENVLKLLNVSNPKDLILVSSYQFDSGKYCKTLILQKRSDDLKKRHLIILDKEGTIKAYNSNIIFPEGYLGAISMGDNNIYMNGTSGKSLTISQEYGGGSPKGDYGIKLNLGNKKIMVNSITFSAKVFLKDSVKVVASSEKVLSPLTKKTILKSQFNKLSEKTGDKIETTKFENYYQEFKENFENKNYRWIKDNTQTFLEKKYKIFNNRLTKYNDIAYFFEQSGANKEAVAILEKIISKFPDRTVAYINLGDAYWGLGNKAKAREAYRTYSQQMEAASKTDKIPQRVTERIN